MVSYLYFISDKLLIYPYFLIFLASVYFTFKLRFVQLRTIKSMLKMLIFNKQPDDADPTPDMVSPRSALLVVLSTSIGMGNISGPIIMMGLAGPGAVAGFLLASFFSAATVFLEVFAAIKFRQIDDKGNVSGGAIAYIEQFLGRWSARTYAVASLILLSVWSAFQANQLAVVLLPSGLSKELIGVVLAILVIVVLAGGIKRVGALNEKLVPIMFIVYVGTALVILLQHWDKILPAISLVFSSFCWPQAALGFSAGYAAMRWGMTTALQANEGGLGTSTYPHANTSETNPYNQAVLSMVSVYANTLLGLLTSLVVLVTDVWTLPGTIFDITLFSHILKIHFPGHGPIILMLICIMFAFGTILGNSFNASRCFFSFADRNNTMVFYAITMAAIIFGATCQIKFLRVLVDMIMLPVAILNMVAIFILVAGKGHDFIFAKPRK